MADTRKIVKVFIASPGDLSDERHSAKLVVEEFNKHWAEHLGCHVELIGWEDTVSRFGRPQEIINQELERCELFVGLLFRRWGTPPGGVSSYSSGFEEEFETSVQRRKESGKPEISLLFKNVDPQALRDPGTELKKVLLFKEKIASERTVLYEEFHELAEFQSKFRACVTKYVQRLEAAEAEKLSDKTQVSRQDDTQTEIIATPATDAHHPLSIQGAQFLRGFVSGTELAPKADLNPVDIARFRLLSAIIGTPLNDERPLGVHDANQIYLHRSELNLSSREIFGLIGSGLLHYEAENTPLWAWYADVNGFERRLLVPLSLTGTLRQRVGALAAMRLVEAIPSDDDDDDDETPTRDHCVASWLSESSTTDVKVAALSYLGDCGLSTDKDAIKAEIDKADYGTTGAAVDAYLRICLRDSTETAVKALYQLQPKSIKDELVLDIFSRGDTLDIELLSAGTSHLSSYVRRICVVLLAKRNALKTDVAEQLLSDDDSEVRFIAVQHLENSGKLFTDDEAKAILVRPSQSGLGILGGSPTDYAGELLLERFRRSQLHKLSVGELEATAARESVFKRNAMLALAEREFKKRGDDLRGHVDDRFRQDFAERLVALSSRIGPNPELIDKIKALEESIRKDLTREGLNVLGAKKSAQDLNRIRTAIKGGFVDHSDTDLEYLRKFGEWEDIKLIVMAIERPSGGAGLLSPSRRDKYRLAAKAICHIGKSRLSEVLTIKMPSELLARLIIEIPSNAFRLLSDKHVLKLLHSQHDRVRKFVALKCLTSHSGQRLEALLADYTSATESFYNVIHWLDFGVSVPKNIVSKAAHKLLVGAQR